LRRALGGTAGDRGFLSTPDLQRRRHFGGARRPGLYPGGRDWRTVGGDRRSIDDQLHARPRMVLPAAGRVAAAGPATVDPTGARAAHGWRPLAAGLALHRSRPRAPP